MVEAFSIDQIFEDGSAIDEAVRCAAVAAHVQYARAGLSMPVWADGRIEWVAPADLSVDQDQAGTKPASAQATSSVKSTRS